MRELTAVQALKPGRSAAREPEKVRAVPHWRVKRVAGFLSPTVARMVRMQECSGMRPGEVCAMRWEEIERGEPCWIYRPTWHKEAWRGMPRAVALGPGARRALVAAGANRRRSGPVFPSPKTGRSWTREAYTRAIERAIKEAVEAGELREEERWTPHALRHSAGTRVRRACGLDAARAVLGHSMRGGVTDVYTFEAAEREALRVAVPAAARWG
jgi:integrase